MRALRDGSRRRGRARALHVGLWPIWRRRPSCGRSSSGSCRPGTSRRLQLPLRPPGRRVRRDPEGHGATSASTPTSCRRSSDGDETISSSRIRAQLQAGRSRARPFASWAIPTGCPARWSGASASAPRRLQDADGESGRPCPRKLLPADGVYAGTVPRWTAMRYLAALNIGMRPTFEGPPPHRRGPPARLCGLSLRPTPAVAVRHYLRPEKRFRSPEDLREQIGRDVAKARQLLMPHGELLPE